MFVKSILAAMIQIISCITSIILSGSPAMLMVAFISVVVISLFAISFYFVAGLVVGLM